MNKKWLSLLLCLCLMLGLTACQKTDPAPVATDVPAVETTEAPAEATEAPAEATEAPAEATEAPAEAAEVTAAPAETESTDTAPAIAELNETDVLMTVNGQEVTWAVAKPYYDNLAAQYSAYYDMSLQENVDMFRSVAAENAFYESLLTQKATELGLAPLSEEDMATVLAEADAIWEENIQYYITNTHPELTAESGEAEVNAARDEAIAYLNNAGYTIEYVRENYAQSAVLERLYNHITQDVTVTDADVEADYQAKVASDKALYENDLNAYIAYNSNVDMNNMYLMYTGQGTEMDHAWYRPAGFRGVKHILLEVDATLMEEYNTIQAQLEEQIAAEGTEAAEGETAEAPATPVTQADLDNAKAAILASCQQKIDEINQRLANGEDFEALIPEYTMDSDNLYEVCIASTDLVPEFVEAAFSIDTVGDVSAPYISQYGIHILKYMEDIPAGPIEMTAEQRAAKLESLLTARKDELYNTAVEEWADAAQVEYTGLVKSYDELLAEMMAEEEAAAAAEDPAEETAETPEVTEAPAAE